MFSLRHCLALRYLHDTMKRKAMTIGILLLLLGCPSKSLASQGFQEIPTAREQYLERQQQTPKGRYTFRVDSLLAELRDATTTRHDLGRLQVFTTDDKMVPLNGEAALLSLVDIVDEAFELWRPTEERPLRVYFLNYETYRAYYAEFSEAYATLWPDHKQPIPQATFGFFVPLSTGEDAYILYTWNWFVHLHEMFHIALSHQVSLLTGLNHGAVDPEVQNAWLSPDVQALVDAATKGELR